MMLSPETVRFAAASFVTLLVVVDPFGLVPLYAAIVGEFPDRQRRRTVSRAVLIGFVVAVCFFAAGRLTLGYLGVSIDAFSISGGILLFATALPMLFGERGGLQRPEGGEQSSAQSGDIDIAVFPLAIPLLSGPGTLTTILVLTAQAHGDKALLAVVAGALVAVYALSWLILRVGDAIVARLGKAGVHVVTRVMGIILAALAVQYVLNGLGSFFRAISPR